MSKLPQLFKKIFFRLGKWGLRVVLFLFIIIILLSVFFILSSKTDIWLYYPAPMRAQTAFSRLQFSCYMLPYESMCDLSCGYERELYQKVISDYLVKGHPLMMKQIRQTIFDKESSLCFKKELISVLKKYVDKKKVQENNQQVKVPTFLVDYLKNPEKEPEVVEEIVAQFGKDVQQKEIIDVFLQQALDKKTECFIREKAIDYLAAGLEEDAIPILKKIILENQNDPDNQWAAIVAAENFALYHKNRKIIDWASRFIQNNENNAFVSDALLGFLAYYVDNVPEEKDYIIKIFKRVYQNESLDIVVRHQAGVYLNYFLKVKKYPPLVDVNDPESEYQVHESVLTIPPYPSWCKPRSAFSK